MIQALRHGLSLAWEALGAFLADDGWAIASHIALSALMALFPFLIVVTSLAGFLGSKELADQAANLLLDTWPHQVAAPIAAEIHTVLTTARGGVLTLGVALALYFATSGIEALRIALNRAYDVRENRSWWLLRLESAGYVIAGAGVALTLSFLVVLGPLIFTTATRHWPWLATLDSSFTLTRYGLTGLALITTLVLVHKWLPAGRRSLADIVPGIVVTLMLSLIAGGAFSQYLARFADAYITTYAGLASAMVALAFLYFIAACFVYGGELNAVIIKARDRRAREAHGQ